MSRNTHDRTDTHTGTMPATLTALRSAIAGYPAGTSIERYVREVWDRLTDLEGPRPPSFSVDATLIYIFTGTWPADAVLRALRSGSMTLDSELVVSYFGSFGIDSSFVRTIVASMQADAVILGTRSGSLLLDSYLFDGTWVKDFSADAKIQKSVLAYPGSDVQASGATYSTGTTGWSLIDETVPSGTDWVRVQSSNAYYVAQIVDPGISADVKQITVRWNGSNGAPAGSGQVIIRNPGTGTRHDVGSIAQSASQVDVVRTTRPWDGQPWTSTDIAQLQIGARSGASLPKVQINQMQVTVVYY